MAEIDLPKNTSELLDSIAGEWSALMQVLEKLTPEQMTRPDAGGWSPKDNLAHLTHWERYMRLHYLEGQPASEAMGIDAATFKDLDEDGINAVIFERNRSRSIEDVLADAQRVHAEVVSVLQQMPFARLLEPLSKDDPEKRPTLLWVLGNTRDHYTEHRLSIEKVKK